MPGADPWAAAVEAFKKGQTQSIPLDQADDSWKVWQAQDASPTPQSQTPGNPNDPAWRRMVSQQMHEADEPTTAVGRVGQQIGRDLTVNMPKGLIQGAGRFLRHPIDTTRQMVGEMNLDDPSKSSGLLGLPDELYEEYKQGRGDQAAAHLIETALPAAGEGISKVASKIPRNTGELLGADPELLSWQALKPRGGIGEHYNTAQTVMGDIKAAAQRRNWNIGNTRDLKAAIDAAENDNRSAFSQFWNTNQSPIPLDHVGDLIEQTISPETQRLASLGDPDAIAEIQGVRNYANSFRGQTATPDDFRKLQEQVNAEIHSFEQKTDEKQSKLIAQRGGAAMLDAKARAYRDITRNIAGSDAADLQYRFGRLKDWEAANLQAMDRAGTEKMGTTLQKGAKVADAPGKLFHGSAEQIPTDLAGGKIDAYIKWAFDRVQPTTLPTPGQMPYPTTRQLPAPPRYISGQSPTSSTSVFGGAGSPGGQVNQWQGIGAPPQLPAPTTPYSGSGVTVPDILGRPGQSTGKLLEAPQPGQPPLNVQPPSNTGHPMPPAGTNAAGFDKPRPLGLPAPPPIPPPVVRHMPAAGEPMPAQQYSTEPIAVQMGKRIRDQVIDIPPEQ